MTTFETKKIDITLDRLGSFNYYLATVLEIELQIDPVLSGFIQYHYDQIKLKIVLKMAALISKGRKQGKISFNYADVKTLSILFKLIPCSGYMLTIEFDILDGLILE